MTNTEIRKKILDFCYKDVLGFTSLYVEKNKGKNWLEVNMSSEFNDLVDKLYQAVIELLSQEIEKAREEGTQNGWKECEAFYGDMREILRPYHKEGEDYRNTLKRLLSKLKGKEWNKTALETYKQATQDTTEEWVEGLRKLMSTWGKVLYVNKGRIGKGMQTDMYTRFYKFVKQLLDDREREAYHDGYTDGVTRCMDSLNKLEEDKNEGA